MATRRAISVVCLAACILMLAAQARADERAARVEASLARAAAYLASRQSEDGAWRSGVHGSFRDGPSLSPHVLASLYFVKDRHASTGPALTSAARYLRALTEAQSSQNGGEDVLHYPVYTAAAISRIVMLDDLLGRDELSRLRDGWIKYIRARQLNAANGWSRTDPEFGGWGYSPAIPRRQPAGQGRGLMMDSNLSATMYAVEALRAANVPDDDPALADALIFIDRCQNFADNREQDARFDDGGFFFMPGDPSRNKAGSAGTDRFGRERFYSYGSATADGIRAMLACGRIPAHPRVAAATQWLARNFDAAHHAGTFNPDRGAVRQGNYFYYCWSLAHALSAVKVTELETNAGSVKWAETLTDELIKRQGADGSWANDVCDGREDDPLVATSFAAETLAICADGAEGKSRR